MLANKVESRLPASSRAAEFTSRGQSLWLSFEHHFHEKMPAALTSISIKADAPNEQHARTEPSFVVS
jgi:hypothetical protein